MRSDFALFFLFCVLVLAFALMVMDTMSIPVVAFDDLNRGKCVYIEESGHMQPCDGLQLPKRYFTVLVDGANLPASLCADGYKQFCRNGE